MHKRVLLPFCIASVGKGTEIMTRLVPGDTLDCLGPLGEPFVTSKNMLLVGGGVGIAPMLCIASHLKRRGRGTSYSWF